MTYNELWHRLSGIYDAGEARAITRLVLEEQYGMTLTDIVSGKVEELSPEEQKQLEEIFNRLEKAEPVQYVLGKETFAGRTFTVSSQTLIPRPETVELCEWVRLSFEKGKSPTEAKETALTKILDIGTGTGCIAITLSLDVMGADVEAWDLSAAALHTARTNAERLGAHVNVRKQDALNPPTADNGVWDVIVSNPPYICLKEEKDMARNVLEYEPRMALFVPDENPLLFYRSIAHYARHALKPQGMLFFEINPIYVKETLDMLKEEGFGSADTRNDMFGKIRFVKAIQERQP